MKKILFLTRSLGIAGVPKSLISLIKTFKKDECEITIGTLSSDLTNASQLPKWVKVISIEEIINKEHAKFLRFQKYCKEKRFLFLVWKFSNQIEKKIFKKTIRKNFQEVYDVANAYHQGLCSSFVIKLIKSKKKYLWYHSSTIMDDCKENVFAKADKIILVNPLIKQIICDHWKKIDANKICSIPCYIDSDEIKKLSLETVDIQENSFVTVSRLSKEKGLNLIVETCIILKRENLNFNWYVIGDGPLLEPTLKEIEKNGLQDFLHLIGKRENPYPYIKKCCILVSTSSLESFGLTMAEAKILNTPVVATETIGSLFLIRNNIDGALVKYNSQELANILINLLTNKSKIEYFKKNLEAYDYGQKQRESINLFKQMELENDY